MWGTGMFWGAVGVTGTGPIPPLPSAPGEARGEPLPHLPGQEPARGFSGEFGGLGGKFGGPALAPCSCFSFSCPFLSFLPHFPPPFLSFLPLLSFQNVKLLDQFICPHSGIIFHPIHTGEGSLLCPKRSSEGHLCVPGVTFVSLAHIWVSLTPFSPQGSA